MEHCEFGVLKDELIQDWIVVGLKDKLSEKLQLDYKLSLEKAVTQGKEIRGSQEIARHSAGNATRPSLS